MGSRLRKVSICANVLTSIDGISFRIYYQNNLDRIQTCPVNVHYLLHVADAIQYNGPPWTYWAFPMERFCSFIGAQVKSRRFPYVNISRRIRDTIQLRIIRDMYNMDDIISFGKTKASRMEEEDSEGPSNADSIPECTSRRHVIRAC
jgi:hypothetical protein